MPEIIQCPQCQRRLNVPEALMGANVKCPACGQTFTALTEALPPVPRSEAVPVEDQPYERPPRSDEQTGERGRTEGGSRGSNFEDDYFPPSTQPHRGGAILALGIVGLCLSCCPLAGWIMGGMAWSMGNRDILAMSCGKMDREGMGLTIAGRVLGIIALAIASLSALLNCLIRLQDPNF